MAVVPLQATANTVLQKNTAEVLGLYRTVPRPRTAIIIRTTFLSSATDAMPSTRYNRSDRILVNTPHTLKPGPWGRRPRSRRLPRGSRMMESTSVGGAVGSPSAGVLDRRSAPAGAAGGGLFGLVQWLLRGKQSHTQLCRCALEGLAIGTLAFGKPFIFTVWQTASCHSSTFIRTPLTVECYWRLAGSPGLEIRVGRGGPGAAVGGGERWRGWRSTRWKNDNSFGNL